MKRIVLLAVIVLLVALAVGAAALAGSSALDTPDLSKVNGTGGGGIAQQVE
jgi:hypothetical protein